MYESTLAGTFLYIWGAHDHHNGLIGRNGISLNAQNPLDNLLGDLCGRTSSGRWFLAEFKRYRSGFASELTSKPQRAALLAAIAANNQLTRISSRAHFAIWQNGRNILAAEYAAVAKPASFYPTPTNFMRGRALTLPDFYKEINVESKHRHPLEKAVYSHGLGVPASTMLEYMRHVVEFNDRSINPSEETLYIFANVKPTSAITYFCGTNFKGLWYELHEMTNMAEHNRPKRGP